MFTTILNKRHKPYAYLGGDRQNVNLSSCNQIVY